MSHAEELGLCPVAGKGLLEAPQPCGHSGIGIPANLIWC